MNDKHDVFETRIDIVKNQTYYLDIRMLFSTYSTSMNFSSNNPYISLPGLRHSSFNRKYLDRKITYHKI